MNVLFPPIGVNAAKGAFIAYWKKMEAQRVLDAQKLWYWYFNDKDMLCGRSLNSTSIPNPEAGEKQYMGFIPLALKRAFGQDTVDHMNIRAINVVKRTVDKVAHVYKQPAERFLDGGIQSVVDDAQSDMSANRNPQIVLTQSPADKVYQDLLSRSKIKSKAKQWHRLGRLFNTVIVQPRWIEDTVNTRNPSFAPYMDFLIHTPAWTVVNSQPWDFLHMESYYYPVWQSAGDGTLEQMLVYWSEREHYFIDKLGNAVDIPGNEERSNPYGRLPAAVLRFNEGSDFWGEGMWGLVEGNEEVSLQLTNLMYTLEYQTHGQLVGINTGIKGTLKGGPDQPIMIENVTDTSHTEVKVLEFKPELAEARNTIDWILKMLQSHEGLNPNQLSTEVTISSGASKMMDNADLNEQRQDDQAILELFEADLFDATRAVWNYHNPGKQIDKAAKFTIKFGEPKVIETVTEQIQKRAANVELLLNSRTDYILEDNPGLTREDAYNKLKQNLIENRDCADNFGMFPSKKPDTLNAALDEETAEPERGMPVPPNELAE
jgi:hypothetical protein